jgi:hypothetical protein
MAFPYSSGDVLTATDLNQSSGLVLVKTQTIGSGVSSVTVTDAFSSTFENYRLIVDSSTSDNSAMLFALQSGSANWYGNRLELINTLTTVTVIASGGGGQTTAEIGRGGAARQSFISVDIYAPAAAFRKGITGNYYGSGYNGTFGYESPDGTARTGFVLSRSTGTFNSGNIRVYGYNDG